MSTTTTAAADATGSRREDGVATVVASMTADDRAQVCGLDDEGFLRPVPASAGVPRDRCVDPPAHRATVAHLVEAADAVRVVELWELARAEGVASGAVRFPASDEQWALTFADARPQHGCWLATLTPLGARGGGSRAVVEAVRDLRPRTATLRKTTHAVILDVDPRAELLFGIPAADLLGRRSTEFLHPDDITTALDGWVEMLSCGTGYRSRLRHRRGDGTWLWIEVVHEPGLDAQGEVVVRADITDVSAEVEAQEELRRREQLFRRTVEALPVGLLRLDAAGEVVQVNARFGALLGTPGHRGGDTTAPLAERLAGCWPDGSAHLLAAVERCVHGGGDARVQVRVGGDAWSGAEHCAVDVVALGADDGEPGVLLVVSDVTEATRLQEGLARRATTDPLTGCLNRSAVLAALDAALAAAPADGTNAPAAVFLDLDGFKAVNDRLGHAVGDDILVCVATALRACVQGWAGGRVEVARLGGDEFLLVLLGSRDEAQVQALSDEVCARLRTDLRATAPLAGWELAIGASAGAARAAAGDTAGTLVARADAAMYVAKRAGRRADWGDPRR